MGKFVSVARPARRALVRGSLAVCLAIALTSCTTSRIASNKGTISSFDRPVGKLGEVVIQPGMIRFSQADLSQVLEYYQDLSRRTVLRSPQVPQNVKISVVNSVALSQVEALRLFDTLLAQQGIAMIFSGDDTVKVVPAALVPQESPPVIDMSADELPDSKSVMLRVVKLKKVQPVDVIGIIQPFASLPQSIIAVSGSKILYLRDYSANVKQMLWVIEEVEKSGLDAHRPPPVTPRRATPTSAVRRN